MTAGFVSRYQIDWKDYYLNACLIISKRCDPRLLPNSAILVPSEEDKHRIPGRATQYNYDVSNS